MSRHRFRRCDLMRTALNLPPGTAVAGATLGSYREAVELYLRPGLGHLRLIDLRSHHVRDLTAAMRLINRPAGDQDESDLLRRLLDARASRGGKRVSTRPLTDARIRRVLAVLRSALADLVPATLPDNPAAGVRVGRSRKVRPLGWTQPRVDRWLETGEIPGRVMVWTAQQCGAFLDSAEGLRLYALFHLCAYYGLRRSELTGLCWSDVDLAARRIHVRQAQVAADLDSTKSEDSERIIIIDEDTAAVLRAWRRAQLAERMAWGSAWADSGRAFIKESGAPLRPRGSARRSTRSSRRPPSRPSRSTV